MSRDSRGSIGQWIDVVADGDPRHDASSDERRHWEAERLKRPHGLQVALDVIAHAQSLPMRLLRRNRLAELDKTFTGMVRQWLPEVQTILSEHGTEQTKRDAAAGIEALLSESKVHALRDWVLSLATDSPSELPPELSETYVAWFLDLLPHLERNVWLTDMSNVHPAHGVARMLEHWSLYVLMWAWREEKNFGRADEDLGGQTPKAIHSALGMSRLEIQLVHVLTREGSKDDGVLDREVWLLGGPYVVVDESYSDGTKDPGAHWFNLMFRRYCNNARRSLPRHWRDIQDKAPNANELFDAFATRSPLTTDEASTRLSDSRKALRQLYEVCMDESLTLWPDRTQGRPISRANWETIAALVAWLSRWHPRLAESHLDGDVQITLPGHRLSLLTHWVRTDPGTGVQDCTLKGTTVIDRKTRRGADRGQQPTDVDEVLDRLRLERRDLHIEHPSAFFARARERQHALWTSQVNAISNLLSRHHRRDRPVGEDELGESSGLKPHCDEADHLLRGYAGKVCMYLLQMARAEAAFVMWLDYSVDPPQFRHVGGAERLILHRAHRETRLRKLFEWANTSQEGEAAPCRQGIACQSQLFRAVTHASIVPTPSERKQTSGHGRGSFRAYVDHYPDPKPQDGITVPLLVYGRVIGTFTVNGISSRSQFDLRLHTPLRLVAQMLAQAMAAQSQMWHMRRLNWLASDRPIEEWRVLRADNQYNPLEPVARIFANIFLCPMVLIWLQEPANDTRFKLHGYTRGDLLLRPGQKALSQSPFLQMDEYGEDDEIRADKLKGFARHFAAFGVDIWIDKEHREELKPGSFVQATYNSRAGPIGSGAKVLESLYSLDSAERGDMILGISFATSADAPDYRQTLFGEGSMRQVMAFALVRHRGGEATPVGIVGLYSPSAVSGSSTEPPWATDWRPLVAQMQTYLPYLLEQTEAIANPLNQLRRYLLHEGRNELLKVIKLSSGLRLGMSSLLAIDPPAGQVRPSLRRLLPRFRSAAQGAPSQETKLALGEAERELSRIERVLEQSAKSSSRLLTQEFVESLALMARLIGHHRSLKMHGDPNDEDFNHRVEWFAPRTELQVAFEPYRDAWAELGSKPDFDAIPERLEILGNRRLWNLMTQDLVRNMAKYALPSQPIEIGWSPSWAYGDSSDRRGMLWLRNTALYDEKVDRPELLGSYGYRGSASNGPLPSTTKPRNTRNPLDGQGLGLWGAVQLGEVLDMPLRIDVDPKREAPKYPRPTARYEFRIGVWLDLTRGYTTRKG